MNPVVPLSPKSQGNHGRRTRTDQLTASEKEKKSYREIFLLLISRNCLDSPFIRFQQTFTMGKIKKKGMVELLILWMIFF